MGIYQYTDPATGRNHRFEHAGDAPTDEDYAFMADFLRQNREEYAQKYQNVFGREFEAPDDGIAIGRGYERGKKQVKQAFGETVGTLGEESGLGFLANYGQGLEERGRQELGALQLEQPERMQSTDVDGFGSALTYAGELVGEQIPQLGLGLAATGATAVAAPLLGAGALTTGALGFAAYGVAQAPMLFGNDIQRQEGEVAAGRKANVDVGDALTATFGQAMLESISGKILLGGILKPVGKSVYTRIASRFGGGATAEGLTEVGQQMMERAQAGLPIDSDDAIAEYREAAIAGGLIGGGVRSVGFGERRDTTLDEQTSEQKTTPTVEDYASGTQLLKNAKEALANDPELADASDDLIRTGMDGRYDPLLAEEIIGQRTAGAALDSMGIDRTGPFFTPPTAKNMLDSYNAGKQPATELTPAQETVVAGDPVVEQTVKEAKAKVAEYSAPTTVADVALPEVKPFEKPSLARTVANKLGVETKITDEMLADVGIPKSSPLRLPKSKGTVLGGDLFDPEVQKKLRNFALQSLVRAKFPDLEARVEALIGGADAGLGITPTDINAGFGDGVQSSGPSLEQLDGGDGTSGDTTGATPPVTGPVGDNLRDVSGDAIPTELGAGTLETEVSPEDVAELTQEVDVLTAKPITPVKPVNAALTQAAIPGQETGTARQLIPGTITPVNKQTLQPTGAPQFVEDTTLAPTAVAPTQVRGASIPQADLQAVDDARSAVAQAQLDSTFENNRGKQPEIREYHDSQLDPRDTPEVTTAVDKEGIVELINTKDADLGVTAKAAKLYFKRFRRPVDALAEMGAVSAVGPTQSIERDYTPTQFSFYKGMTNKSAMNAGKWVRSNMSPQAMAVIVDAAALARQDTAKFSPSDAYIGVTKAMKGIQEKEDTAFAKQMNRELASLELQAKEPAALGQEMRGEGPVGAIKPIKGQTAFDSYMLGMGFKKRKVPNKDEYNYFDPENDNRVLTPEEVQEYYDGLAYTQNELGFLLIDPVHGLNQALLPSIRNALQRGDLQFALNAVASTSPVGRIRQIAGKLAEVVGTTKVQVVDDLTQMTGRKAAGMFDPETNTIFIDAANGMNVHTVLHEMTHAGTSSVLVNPAIPEVKQLTALLNAVREQLGDVYGTANLDEFVAEAFSNPEFQRSLVFTRVDGGKMSGWEKFTGSVRNIVRKLLGLQSKRPESALDEVDRIINGMLTPSPATRGAPSMMLLQRTKEGATKLMRDHLTSVPLEGKNSYEVTRDIVNANTPTLLKKFVLGVQPVNSLARLAKDKIPFANDLNVLIDQMSGALRNAFQPVDVIYNDYRAYRKANPKGYAKMQGLMNRATQDEVDPSRPRNTYNKYWMSYYDMQTEKTVMQAFDTDQARTAEVTRLNDELMQKYGGQDKPRSKAKKAGDPSAEKTKVWDTLNKEYKSLGKQGQDLFKITREMGEAAQDRIMPAIKARIGSLGVDAATQKTAFEKLSDLLHAQGGVIRPYFKLGRDGDFRLSYHAPDPLRNGGLELFTEYYTSEKDMMQAEQNVIAYLNDIGREGDISKIETGKRDAKRDYGKAPSSSFVFDVLSTLQLAGVDQASIDKIIDLSLDAIPERSFMQSFRSRKERSEGKRGILGALGDRTPSGMPGMEVDPAERFRDNFRGIEKQLIQLEYGAKIQGFRNKLKDGDYFKRLDTTEIATKLDEIAKFAQAPTMARWSQNLTTMGFAWTMGANISSAFNVMFDIPMAVQPYLGGEYGNIKATTAISNATKLFMGSPSTKMITVMGADGKPDTREVQLGKHNKGFDNHNFDDPNLDPEIRKYKTLVEKAGGRGMFNQSIDQEHTDISDRRDVMAKINQVTGFLVHHAERFGRQITLISAYDLELNKLTDGGKKQATQADYDAAAEKAMNTAELTLGSTASAGRPVWAQNPVGNVVFLFKRFAVSRYYFMAHLLDQSLAGADPETRKIARQQLAYFMMNTGLIAGVSGMPMMGAVAAIYDLFADDDEDDFEAMMRKKMPGTMYDGLANELLGVDVASRVSMNSLLYRQPFIDKDQSRFWTLAEQLGGPVLGVALGMERGAELVGEGNYQRGFEAIAPAAMRNISKSQRFFTEGANTMRGNPIVDDINPYNSFMQLLGFAPADYVENLKINSSERRRKNAVDDRRRKLMRLHNMAKTEGDREGIKSALQKIDEYNDSLSEDYRKESSIKPENLAQSYRGFVKTTGDMVNGIVYSDSMRKSAEAYK